MLRLAHYCLLLALATRAHALALTGLRVRGLQPTDVADVCSLRVDIFSPHLTSTYSKYLQARLFADAMANKTAVLVAERPDASGASRVVGSADMLVVPLPDAAAACYVTNVCVDAAVRRAGIARSLMDEVEVRAHGLGAAALALHVEDTNTVAAALYTALSFEAATDVALEAAFAESRFVDPEGPPQRLMTKWLPRPGDGDGGR